MITWLREKRQAGMAFFGNRSQQWSRPELWSSIEPQA
jgi:hypothetical protein